MKVFARNITKNKIKIKFKIISTNPEEELNFINSSLKMKTILNSMQTEQLITHLFKIKADMDWGNFLVVSEIKVIEKYISSSERNKEEDKKSEKNHCPKCTYINPLNAIQCQVCEASLITTDTSTLTYPSLSSDLSNQIDDSKTRNQGPASHLGIAKEVLRN